MRTASSVVATVKFLAHVIEESVETRQSFHRRNPRFSDIEAAREREREKSEHEGTAETRNQFEKRYVLSRVSVGGGTRGKRIITTHTQRRNA